MNKLNILDLTFDLSTISSQRNGISGESFYTLYGKDGEIDIILTVSTTFVDDNEVLDPTQCRVVTALPSDRCYRGDRIGYQLETLLGREELTKLITNKMKNEFC